MKSNTALVEHFYNSFQQKDIPAMQECYADNATFHDPVFTDLNASQVRAMWSMLLSSAKDMRMEFRNVKERANGATAEWEAHYTFSKTGRKVVNHVKADFIIENGKIVQHRDAFNFHTWAKQALGMPGLLLGWTSFLRSKIGQSAKKSLEAYMKSKG